MALILFRSQEIILNDFKAADIVPSVFSCCYRLQWDSEPTARASSPDVCEETQTVSLLHYETNLLYQAVGSEASAARPQAASARSLLAGGHLKHHTQAAS